MPGSTEEGRRLPGVSLSGMPTPTIRLLGVELRWLDFHLLTPHVSALGSTTERPVVLARVVTEASDGWGECAALVAPNYSEEYAEGAWSVLCEFLVPLLLEGVRRHGAILPQAEAVPDLLGSIRGHSMAKACLEMAVLDSGLRSAGRSLADLIGAKRVQVEAGAVVGLSGTGDEVGVLFREVQELVCQGFSRVKVKIAPGADVGTLGGLRRAFPHLGIQADANGGYRLDVPAHLAALEAIDGLGLLCIEQPLEPDDLVGHAALANGLVTPVCLDESIWSLGRLHQAIAAGACDMVCIKASRLGGLLQAVQAHDICAKADIPLWCGGMLETALARSANAALSALPGFLLPGDLAGGERFREPDPFLAGAGPEVPRTAEPTVIVHKGPGVGPEPDLPTLDVVTTRRHWTGI
jgi:o-succinylbenzoate synthase